MSEIVRVQHDARNASRAARLCSAVVAAFAQLETTERNVELARELVVAEQRAFDLGRSDLLRIQLREVQLADARLLAVDALLAWQRARTAHRAARGDIGTP